MNRHRVDRDVVEVIQGITGKQLNIARLRRAGDPDDNENAKMDGDDVPKVKFKFDH